MSSYFLFQVRVNSINCKTLKIVQHVDVAIKSYVISILTGSTSDGFIDCTNIVMVKDLDEDSNIIHKSEKVKKMGFEYSSKL